MRGVAPSVSSCVILLLPHLPSKELGSPQRLCQRINTGDERPDRRSFGCAILVIGGGPAGLLFATLAARADSANSIEVFEQNPAGATYGFGVVLADVALSILDDVDPVYDRRSPRSPNFRTASLSYTKASR